MGLITTDKNKIYDMVLLGRAAIDLNPLDYGKTLAESETFKKYVGGSPANIAIGLSRLGKKCGFISRVSNDRFGEFVTEFFKREGVDTSQIRKCVNGESLGLTFTEILSQDESSILMYRNGIADLSLSPEDIEEAYLKQFRAILISGTALAASPSREATLKAIALAKKNGLLVVFDIDYRGYNWKSLDETSIYYALAARDSHIILGSREEYDLMECLLGLDGRDETSAAYWCRQGVSIIVIKHGKEGSCAYTKDGKFCQVRPFPVNALKGFGGGDGYGSAFLYGVLEGMELWECLELGSASAAMLVASHGCSAYMPTLKEVRSFIQKEKKQYDGAVVQMVKEKTWNNER